MFEITKGYKQGRAVLFYDLLDPIENKTSEKVSKDNVVQLCTDGKISNAKIQWWEGKAIVRVQNKNLPLVRVDENNNIIGVAYQAVRSNTNKATNTVKPEPVVDVSSKAKVTGKVSNRKASKQSIAYAGYDYRNIVEQQELNSSISYDGIDTIEDLFDTIATEFGVKQKESYKAEFAKKVRLDKQIKDMQRSNLLAIQSGMATYLMTMAHNEVNEVFMKYNVR